MEPHSYRPERAVRISVLGILANVLLAGAKGIAGVLGHSYALIADAVESALDIVGSLVVWGGMRIALIPPDEDHPFGHGKAEPLAALVVAVGLMIAAVGIAIQSVREIMNPHHAPAPFTLVVLAVVVVLKEALYRYMRRVGLEVGSTALKADAWHHRSDALTSLAAFIGISIALWGGPGYEAADDWAALIACAVIGYNGYCLIKPALAEVMDAAPPAEWIEQAREAAASVEGVIGLDVCVGRKMGFDLFIDLHIEVDGAMSVREGHELAHIVKDAIRAANPRVRDVLIHVEPREGT